MHSYLFVEYCLLYLNKRSCMSSNITSASAETLDNKFNLPSWT